MYAHGSPIRGPLTPSIAQTRRAHTRLVCVSLSPSLSISLSHTPSISHTRRAHTMHKHPPTDVESRDMCVCLRACPARWRGWAGRSPIRGPAYTLHHTHKTRAYNVHIYIYIYMRIICIMRTQCICAHQMLCARTMLVPSHTQRRAHTMHKHSPTHSVKNVHKKVPGPGEGTLP
jgi:hypothetical protein